MDAPIAQQIVATANDGGMGQTLAEVVIAQIGVCVEMDDVQLRIFLHHGAHSAERDQMFAAEHDWHLSSFQDLSGTRADLFEHSLGVAKRQQQVAAVEHGDVFEVLVLIRAVGLNAVTFRANGARAKARARTKRRRPSNGAPKITARASSKSASAAIKFMIFGFIRRLPPALRS